MITHNSTAETLQPDGAAWQAAAPKMTYPLVRPPAAAAAIDCTPTNRGCLSIAAHSRDQNTHWRRYSPCPRTNPLRVCRRVANTRGSSAVMINVSNES